MGELSDAKYTKTEVHNHPTGYNNSRNYQGNRIMKKLCLKTL